MSLKIWDGLREMCRSSEADLLHKFRADGFKIETVKKDRYYAFKDNGSNVLAVAHLDTVSPSARRFRFDKKERKVVSLALDDRLGVFIITKILPLFGVKPDILLTTDEESGNSTGEYFVPDKDYNWIFSFDRRGDDVVMYKYQTDELETILEDNGFEIGWGTFSDITSMGHLGVSGFNYGTGYYNAHSKACFAMLDITIQMVAKFVGFFEKYANTKLEYVPDPRNEYLMGYYGYDYDKADDGMYTDYYINCEVADTDRAVEFEDNHIEMGHMVDFYMIDDKMACVDCYDCDKQIIFNYKEAYWD